MKLNETDNSIIAALTNASNPMSCKDLATVTGIGRDLVYKSLYKLCNAKIVENQKWAKHSAPFTTPGEYVLL